MRGKTTATPWSQNYIGYEMKYYVNDVTLEAVEVLAETNGAGGMRHVYTYGTQRITDEAFGVVENFAYDGQGNVRQVMQGGSVVRSLSYGLYGEVEQGSLPYRTFYGYNGEEHNPETNLQYLRARYYEAASARFTSQDAYGGEAEKPLTQNKYLYANGDPVNYNDPGGLAAVKKPAAGKTVNTSNAKATSSVSSAVKAAAGASTAKNNTISKAPAPQQTTPPKNNGSTSGGSNTIIDPHAPPGSSDRMVGVPSGGGGSGGNTVLPTIKLDMQVQTLNELNRKFCSAEALRAKGTGSISRQQFINKMKSEFGINDVAAIAAWGVYLRFANMEGTLSQSISLLPLIIAALKAVLFLVPVTIIIGMGILIGQLIINQRAANEREAETGLRYDPLTGTYVQGSTAASLPYTQAQRDAAVDTLNREVARIQGLNSKNKRSYTMVCVAINIKTNDIKIGAKIIDKDFNFGPDIGILIGEEYCAEDMAAYFVGGFIKGVVFFTWSIRPATGKIFPPCSRCLNKYGAESFFGGAPAN